MCRSVSAGARFHKVDLKHRGSPGGRDRLLSQERISVGPNRACRHEAAKTVGGGLTRYHCEKDPVGDGGQIRVTNGLRGRVHRASANSPVPDDVPPSRERRCHEWTSPARYPQPPGVTGISTTLSRKNPRRRFKGRVGFLSLGQGGKSIALSIHLEISIGGAEGNRTPDLCSAIDSACIFR